VWGIGDSSGVFFDPDEAHSDESALDGNYLALPGVPDSASLLAFESPLQVESTPMTSDARACPHCKEPNRPEARFCDGCGAPVARASAETRTVRDDTPRHLVDKVLANRSSLESMHDQQTTRECESGALCVRAEALLGLGDAAAAVVSARAALDERLAQEGSTGRAG
jgi:hypothetical protein